MPSVRASWTGSCRGHPTQSELVRFLVELAGRSEQWCARAFERPTFLEVLAQEHAAQSPVPPADVVGFDRDIAGRIVVDADVASDTETLVSHAAETGLESVVDERGRPYLLAEQLGAFGIDFRLYDPRGLYPGDDRMSFVFVRQPELAPLDGRVVGIHDRSWCGAYGPEVIREADWYLERPSLHLRYMLEEWIDILLSWVKFFFVPDLTFWRYEQLPHWPQLHEELSAAQSRQGSDIAKQLAFEGLLAGFEREAERWSEYTAGLADD